MPTQCNPNLFAFAPAEGRPVVVSFDGGAITSDAGALLLGATDRVLGLTRRLAACFKDSRDPAYTEHALETPVMQRVVGACEQAGGLTQRLCAAGRQKHVEPPRTQPRRADPLGSDCR
jgi:hypothetical protein